MGTLRKLGVLLGAAGAVLGCEAKPSLCEASPWRCATCECGTGEVACIDGDLLWCDGCNWYNRGVCGPGECRDDLGEPMCYGPEVCDAAGTGAARCFENSLFRCRDGGWFYETACTAAFAECQEAGGTASCVAFGLCANEGEVSCLAKDVLVVCSGGRWAVQEDCLGQALVCAAAAGGASCVFECAEPAARCNGNTGETCHQGRWVVAMICDSVGPGWTCSSSTTTDAYCYPP